MYNSRYFYCIVFLIVCTSVHFDVVAGFNTGQAKQEVKNILTYMFKLLGEKNIDFRSIQYASDLTNLTTAADNYIPKEKIEALKQKARASKEIENEMSEEFRQYLGLFDNLLREDPETEGKDIPLMDQIAAIAVAWVGGEKQ